MLGKSDLRGKRAAIYARYSSDRQNDRSIADQVALCQELARAHGLVVVARYEDRALSGAATAHRPGFNALVAAAQRREFEVLVVEGPSRLARNLGDLASLHARLKFQDIALLTNQYGLMDDIQVAVLAGTSHRRLS